MPVPSTAQPQSPKSPSTGGADEKAHRWPARIGLVAVAVMLVGCFGVLIAASRAASPAMPSTQPANNAAVAAE